MTYNDVLLIGSLSLLSIFTVCYILHRRAACRMRDEEEQRRIAAIYTNQNLQSYKTRGQRYN